ncbi:MAG: DUF6573 family protein [Woeseiaceae bacterium]|nr:DUF6573 family protein [Woeseiaceae bacterium]
MTERKQANEHPFGPVVYRYTRKQALEDGVLIDVTQMAKEAGFKWPVALTAAAWDDCVAWSDEDNRQQTYQDASGRLWDVLIMAAFSVQSAPEGLHPALFALMRIPRDGTSQRSERRRLKLVLGPGDDGEPVLTIMLPNED